MAMYILEKYGGLNLIMRTLVVSAGFFLQKRSVHLEAIRRPPAGGSGRGRQASGWKGRLKFQRIQSLRKGMHF